MMRWGFIVVLLCSVVSVAAAQDAFFPAAAFDSNPQRNDFKVQWYTKHLAALDEPSLLKQATTGSQIYRFLWLRTFHSPIAVRLNVMANGTSILTVKVTNGLGGYEPGKLVTNRTTTLSKRDTQWFLERVDELGYWNLPSPEPKSDVIGTDGAQWVIEAVKRGRYKVVDRWSPEKGPVRTLGLLMAIDLAKLKLLYQDVY